MLYLTRRCPRISAISSALNRKTHALPEKLKELKNAYQFARITLRYLHNVSHHIPHLTVAAHLHGKKQKKNAATVGKPLRYIKDNQVFTIQVNKTQLAWLHSCRRTWTPSALPFSSKLLPTQLPGFSCAPLTALVALMFYSISASVIVSFLQFICSFTHHRFTQVRGTRGLHQRKRLREFSKSPTLPSRDCPP